MVESYISNLTRQQKDWLQNRPKTTFGTTTSVLDPEKQRRKLPGLHLRNFCLTASLGFLFPGKEDTPENCKGMLVGIPLGRSTSPADIANATPFLAKDEVAFIMGVELPVDDRRALN
jgi:hypothetical protein